MKLTILGSGSVYAAPVMGCKCLACRRAREKPEYVRAETSALLEADGFRIMIDAGLPNLIDYFCEQRIDSILLTHYHMDHVMGLFKLRWGLGQTISVIGPNDPVGCSDLFKNPGILDFERKANAFDNFQLGPFQITPLPMQHSKLTYGYFFSSSFHNIAYLTDTVGLSDKVTSYLQKKKIDLAIIDASEAPSVIAPRNHNDLTMALDIHHDIKPTSTILTHIGHELDTWLENNPDSLPANVSVALDEQVIQLS